MTVVLPEVNFLNTDPQAITDEVIKIYETLEGRKLAEADPLRIIFLSMSSVITKLNVNINDAAKQNLLYYSRGDVLDHKGYPWQTPRLGNTAATSVLRLHIAEPMASARIIKKGTLATSDGDILFVTVEDAIIQPHALFVDIEIECTKLGTIGNGFDIGEINTLVKPLPYIAKVENLTLTAGGTEIESDTAYRDRIHQSPEKLSSAGPTGAYEYFAKSASAAIADVHVDSPEPGKVHVSVLLQNGELPPQEILDEVDSILNSRRIRPLTDLVTVGTPEVIQYDLNIVYYIETEAVDKTLIQQSIEKAIENYIVWQSTKIGRDINPSRLISDCIRAGAKRVEVISPVFKVVNDGQVAQCNAKSVTFGGVEDD